MGDVNVSLALRCPICQEPYCEPKQLNCGHSFCLTCLEGSQHLYSINCPICRKATCFNVPGLNGLRLLPNNYALAQVVEAVVLRDNGDPSNEKAGEEVHVEEPPEGDKAAGGGEKKLCIECPQCHKSVAAAKAWFCADCDGGQKFCSACVVDRHRGSHRCINVGEVTERWRACSCRLDTLKTRLTPVRTALRQIAGNMKNIGLKHARELEKRSDYLSQANCVIEELLEKADAARCSPADCHRLIEFERLLKKLENYTASYGARLITLKETVDEASNALNKINEEVDAMEKCTLDNDTEPTVIESVVVVWRDKEAKSVALAGSFTDWKPTVHLVQYRGEFLTTLQLPKGRYEFKFLVNDEWCQSVDYESCEDGCGGRNNFVIV